jgi:hypothetical protein
MPAPTAALALRIAERDKGKDECRFPGATDWSVVLRSEKSEAVAALGADARPDFHREAD